MINRKAVKGVGASGVNLRSNCFRKEQKGESKYRLGIMLGPEEVDILHFGRTLFYHNIMLIIFFPISSSTPCDAFLHLFENPARPRPNRTLGGTNCRADMAPVRSAISVSVAFSNFTLPLSASAEGGGGSDLVLEGDASFSSVFARLLNSFACD